MAQGGAAPRLNGSPWSAHGLVFAENAFQEAEFLELLSMVRDATKMSRSEPCYQGIEEDSKAVAAVGYRERQSICG